MDNRMQFFVVFRTTFFLKFQTFLFCSFFNSTFSTDFLSFAFAGRDISHWSQPKILISTLIRWCKDSSKEKFRFSFRAIFSTYLTRAERNKTQLINVFRFLNFANELRYLRMSSSAEKYLLQIKLFEWNSRFDSFRKISLWERVFSSLVPVSLLAIRIVRDWICSRCLLSEVHRRWNSISNFVTLNIHEFDVIHLNCSSFSTGNSFDRSRSKSSRYLASKFRFFNKLKFSRMKIFKFD